MEETEFKDEDIIKTEDYIGIGQQRAMLSKLAVNATLMSLLSELVAENENISLDLGIYQGGCRFPHPVDSNRAAKEGTLVAQIGLRIGTGEIYWPGSTNSVRVADIRSREHGIEITSHYFEGSHHYRSGGLFNWIIQACSFTNNASHKLKGLEYEEVKKLHDKALSDVRKIFEEWM
jgi:hypothetical protein